MLEDARQEGVGSCSAISAPFSEAPVPLTVVAMVQIGSACSAGLSAAGEELTSTEAGRPVSAKVALEMVAATGKLCTSFLNRATEKSDWGAKYHSTARS